MNKDTLFTILIQVTYCYIDLQKVGTVLYEYMKYTYVVIF